MVLLIVNTGLRRGEVLQLKWSDVDLLQWKVIIGGENAKSGKTRYVPLNDEAVSTLQRWQPSVEATGWVFPARDGEAFDQYQNVLEARTEKCRD